MKTFFTYYEEELQKDADMEEHREISVFNPTAPNRCRRFLKRWAKGSKRSKNSRSNNYPRIIKSNGWEVKRNHKVFI